MKGGKVEILVNDQGNRITPSYVAFMDNGDRLVGDAAKNAYHSNTGNTVFNTKRLIGRKVDDLEVEHNKEHGPFHIVKKSDKPAIEVKYKGEDRQFVSLCPTTSRFRC